jgi:hypothetical protein
MDTAPIGKKTERGPALLWGAALLFLGLLIWIWIPSVNIGFSSDDLVHLVEDSHLPWYTASDHLNRPLRDGLFRMLPALFGLNPLPYRLLAFFFYALTALLLFQFVTQLGIRKAAAFAVTVFFAFFPRNYESLFWFAAFQDVIVSSCILLACCLWLSYLRNRDLRSFLGAHLAYIVALGFKETAIGLPVVLLGLELFTSDTGFWRESLWRRLRKYWLFVPIAAALAAFVLVVGSHAATIQQSRPAYVGTSVFGILPPLARTFVNLILQFSPAVAVRDLSRAQIAMVAVGCLFIGLLVWIAASRRLALFSLAWFLVFALPTAAFARAVNADRYLMLPYIALLFIVAGALDRMEPMNGRRAALLAAVLLIYGIAGGQRLMHFREAYQQAAVEVDTVGTDAARLIKLPDLSSQAAVVLVNLTSHGEVGVLNNGVKGALVEKGLPGQVRVIYNFSQSDGAVQQEELVQSIESCRHERESVPGTAVLLYSMGHLTDDSGSCAIGAIQNDIRRRPDAWYKSPGNARPAPSELTTPK